MLKPMHSWLHSESKKIKIHEYLSNLEIQKCQHYFTL